MSVKTKRKASVNGHPAKAGREVVVASPREPIPQSWLWAIGIGTAFLALLAAYGPALQGEFLFDDVHMKFAAAHPETFDFKYWIAGARPFAEFLYFVDWKIGGLNPLPYHLTNLVLHLIAALMVFFVVRKILDLAAVKPRRGLTVAVFCGAVFLLHPLQTEAVAYVASQSESLSVAFAFGAWAAFLYRPTRAIGTLWVLLILALCGAGVGSKQHVAAIAAVFVLTDYYWNPGFSFEGIRRNWKLYGTMVVLGGVLAVLIYRLLLGNDPTVGFHLKDMTPLQYLFTQCRVFFLYLQLFLFPVDQNADIDIALSHSIWEHGAFIGMAVLIAAIAAAIRWRKQFPIASFGFFTTLILLLPTSSFFPIKDLAAERRVYLPMVGLLLIVAEILVRVRWNERVLTVVLTAAVAALGGTTWNRNHVWSNSLALWSDTVEKSPQKARARLGLAAAELGAHRYADAVPQYEMAARLDPDRDGIFYNNWALALEGAGRLKEALAMAEKAVQKDPSAADYDVLGKMTALNGDIPRALELLNQGEQKDPGYVPIFIHRGDILMALDRNAEACAAFQKVKSLDPPNESAAKGLATLHCPGSQ